MGRAGGDGGSRIQPLGIPVQRRTVDRHSQTEDDDDDEAQQPKRRKRSNPPSAEADVQKELAKEMTVLKEVSTKKNKL